jgi:hypothetical protein
MEKTYYELVQEEKAIGEALDLLRDEMEVIELVEQDWDLLDKQKAEYIKLLKDLFEVGKKIDEMEREQRRVND